MHVHRSRKGKQSDNSAQVIQGHACSNGSKILLSTPCDIPMPVSFTVNKRWNFPGLISPALRLKLNRFEGTDTNMCLEVRGSICGPNDDTSVNSATRL